jgi:HSP20 family protein
MWQSIWDELEDINRRIDEAFRTSSIPRRRFALPARPAATVRPFVPTTDVFARNGDLVIRLDLPGIDPEREEVGLTVKDGELAIRGERKQDKEVKEADYYLTEACYGAFERHFPVPIGTDEKAVRVQYKDGVLEVVVKDGVEIVETEKQQAKSTLIETVKTPELVAKA